VVAHLLLLIVPVGQASRVNREGVDKNVDNPRRDL
jgi:hypothetical protein